MLLKTFLQVPQYLKGNLLQYFFAKVPHRKNHRSDKFGDRDNHSISFLLLQCIENFCFKYCQTSDE